MDDILEIWAYWLQHTIILMFWEGMGMVGDNEHNLDPLINDSDTYVILTGMVPCKGAWEICCTWECQIEISIF